MLPDLVIPATFPPDPLNDPIYYRGVLSRRIFAYIIDIMVVAAITIALHVMFGLLTILSFGLLGPLHVLFAPIIIAFAYHSLLIGSAGAATLGMRAFGLKVYDLQGTRPTLLQALILTVCFYVSVGFSGGLLLLAVLFNRHRRTLHDFVANTIMLRNP